MISIDFSSWMVKDMFVWHGPMGQGNKPPREKVIGTMPCGLDLMRKIH